MTLSEPAERSKKQERALDWYNVQDAGDDGTAELHAEINEAECLGDACERETFGAQSKELTSYSHAMRPVGLASKELIPHFPYVMKRTPWRTQKCPPASTVFR